MDKWREVWNKDERINDIILECLIKADGFDTGAGNFTVADWKNYTSQFYDRFNLDNNESIFEVGCGSGAFIYPLAMELKAIGGLDYSEKLIALANTLLPKADFTSTDAINLDPNKKYDIVLSHSVFHYFKDLDYAKAIVKKMVQKSNNIIAILDINDQSKSFKYYEIRRGKMSIEDYEKKYEGLNHQFYDKQWFIDLSNQLNLKIDIFDQTFKNYANSDLRFNVIMEK